MVWKILKRWRRDLAVRSRQNALGHTEGSEKVYFFVSEKKSEDELHRKDILPKRIHGKPTKVVQIGEVEPQVWVDRQITRTEYNYYGTLGLVVWERTSPFFAKVSKAFAEKFGDFHYNSHPVVQKRKLVLTNMHVADKNMSPPAGAKYGVHAMKPDLVMFRYVRGVKSLDAALLEPITSRGQTWIDTHQMELETKDPTMGQKVLKVGRTTAKTEGELVALDVTMYITYKNLGRVKCTGLQMYAGFDGQPFSQKGDSGSVIVDDKHAYGLLFAGNDTYTFAYPMTKVTGALGIDTN